MKCELDEKAGELVIRVKYDAKGRTGNGKKWPKIHACDTSSPDIKGEIKRLQVTCFGQ
jgi:hypothetical protein